MRIDRRRFLKVSAVSTVAAGLSKLGLAADPAAPDRPHKPLVEPFAFCAVADIHASEKAQRGYPERLGNHVDRFFACVREMDKLEGEDKPDFMLILGDIHLWELRKHLDRVTLPVHVIAGNHDAGGAKREIRNFFPADFKRGGHESDYYSFVHKGVRFIGVCNAIADHVGHLCSSNITPSGQCEWLEGELAGPEAHKIIFGHIPPEPEGGDRNMYLARNDARYFNALMEKTGPTAAFFGHLHKRTTELRIGRTKMLTLRACCWNGDRSPLGFMVVKVNQEGIATREIDTGTYR